MPPVRGGLSVVNNNVQTRKLFGIIVEKLRYKTEVMKKLLVIAGATFTLTMVACRNDTLSEEAMKDGAVTTVQTVPGKTKVVYVDQPQRVQYRTSTTNNAQVKKGMSGRAKGAIIGGVGGAVVGGVATKSTKGAVIGGVVGAGVGYLLGRKKDKRTGRLH
jgi:hypothetical protein